jgi:hypothetical protein
LEKRTAQREDRRNRVSSHFPWPVLGRVGDDAMNVTYEIRTLRNARVFAYESLHRAQEERLKAEKRVGVKMQIVKITHMEEVLHD